MHVYSQIIKAQLENKAGDYGSPGCTGLIWFNTVTGKVKFDDGTTIREIPFGAPSGNSVPLHWIESLDSPSPNILNNNVVYSFAATMGQTLYAMIRVPTGYFATSQISLKFLFYSSDTSGNVLMQTVATLIRAGTDTVTSATNQRTSTNTAVTLSAPTANIPQAVSADLTSSSGQINSVSVAAGDLVQIALTRSVSDTATGDVQVLVYGAEVTFS